MKRFFCSYKNKFPCGNHGFPMKTLPKKAYTPIFPQKSQKRHPYFFKKNPKKAPLFFKKKSKKGTPILPKNEEFLHTLLDFRGFPGNFRRIPTHTSGILGFSREFSKNSYTHFWISGIFPKFSKNSYTHFWNFRKFPEIFEELVHTLFGPSGPDPPILRIDLVGYFTEFFFVRTKNASCELSWGVLQFARNSGSCVQRISK